ncbi:hypothetical protein OC25_17605 [Pedobacter kyungheensis]|uniref:Nucleotidyl transferase AbiEii/AbiGii toxin family protein n=1 Tax=Pedobacter kyungheensis TaxID=1069985 RepID=A0A0C1FGZ1_9SPHI|nr:nucleotidyl transferase AbiEii/AbiGii toxin family protein [Pedobacter kyungheensis]KIA92252.1 hypothetical protein OC25_17605 [Pedobacter kyungheensis]
MINPKSLSAEWLAEKKTQYKKDPGLIENMIHALHLLEALKLSGLDFIFKGGTSLILMLEEPQRFSVDIDIIVPAGTSQKELESHLDKVIELSSFTKYRLDHRRSYQQGIPKAHYGFSFGSNVPTRTKEGQVVERPEKEILLDVLFAENHYPVLTQRPIHTEWLLTDGDPIMVTTPDVCSIAGDKLTAFAPNTTGVPYHREGSNSKGEKIQSEMFMEIIKQAFDVGCLFDRIKDLNTFKKAYQTIVDAEIKYRANLKIESMETVLHDTINTSLVLARNLHQAGDLEKQHHGYLTKGIGQFGHYVFKGAFRIEQAQVATAKAAYLAAIILSGTATIERFDPKVAVSEYHITHREFQILNKKLKFVAKGEALFYWSSVIKLIYTEKNESENG